MVPDTMQTFVMCIERTPKHGPFKVGQESVFIRHLVKMKDQIRNIRQLENRFLPRNLKRQMMMKKQVPAGWQSVRDRQFISKKQKS